MVLGKPFTVDGETYTPADTLNYDRVGYASIDQGHGITAANKTLPLPSYIEVTSLDSGKTILVRVERRGPMTGARLISLSPEAASQLGISDDAPVRVRRVNPPEVERAELRAGQPAPERMETPKSLVAVLRQKLPAQGDASLRSAVAQEDQPDPVAVASAAPRPTPAPIAAPVAGANPSRTAASAYPLAPINSSNALAQVAARVADKPEAHASAPPTVVAPRVVEAAQDGFVIQAGTFADKSNADRAAGSLGGFISRSGKYYRVRTGPYATRGQAEAALVKVQAAGYSDARVFTAG